MIGVLAVALAGGSAIAAGASVQAEPDEHGDGQHHQHDGGDLHRCAGEELPDGLSGQQEAAGGYVGHGQQRNGNVVRAVIGDGDGAQLVAGGDGGVHGVHAGHSALQLLQLQVLGQHRLGGVGRADGHGGYLVAQGHGHLADQLVLIQHRAVGKVVEAPVEQPGRLGKALHPGAARLGLDLLAAQHHTDEGSAAPDGGGYQTVARRVGGAGLDALCAGVEIAGHAPVGDQGVGAVELTLLVGHVGGGHGVGLGVDDGHEHVVLHGLPG